MRIRDFRLFALVLALQFAIFLSVCLASWYLRPGALFDGMPAWLASCLGFLLGGGVLWGVPFIGYFAATYRLPIYTSIPRILRVGVALVIAVFTTYVCAFGIVKFLTYLKVFDF